jgi:hypothetical protein
MAYPGIKSFVNQPTRIFLSSDNDTSTPRNGAYSQFSITFPTPILGARRAQLLRCTIPNASATGVTIPDYMSQFWYYQLATASTSVAGPVANTTGTITNANYVNSTGIFTYTVANTFSVGQTVVVSGITYNGAYFNRTGIIATASSSAFTIAGPPNLGTLSDATNQGSATTPNNLLPNANLKCIRLYPSNFVPRSSTAYTTYVKNRFFSDPNDLVTALNAAASSGGDVATYNPYWVSGDVSFSYSTSTKQITMTGLTSGKYYAIAGYNDPNVAAALQFMTIPLFSGGTSIQPSVVGYTLNLRVGYALSGQASALQGTPASDGTQNILYANLTNTAFAQNAGIPPDAFPDLVYTQNIYLYSSVCVGSSVTSNGRHNLLSVAPITANQLVVSQYIALTLNYLNNVADTIYTIVIEMRDDNNQPFYLNDNNTVNVELALSYVDV